MIPILDIRERVLQMMQETPVNVFVSSFRGKFEKQRNTKAHMRQRRSIGPLELTDYHCKVINLTGLTNFQTGRAKKCKITL